MPPDPSLVVCWKSFQRGHRVPGGLEHLVLSGREADSQLIAFDDGGRPFRLSYRLQWDEAWRLRRATLQSLGPHGQRSLILESDGHGRWRDGQGRTREDLDGCVDIDIWPTPFTNSFPLRREPMAIGQRHLFRMAWVAAPELSVQPFPQAYTRIDAYRYRYESLDGSGFTAVLQVDDAGLVIDYPGLFRRVGAPD